MNQPLLDVRQLRKLFPIKKGVIQRVVDHVHAVDDVSFSIYAGETLGLVGESGCGKSTVGKTLLRLLKGFEGEIWFDGQPLHQIEGDVLKGLRKDIQMIFQDPMESLNPRHTVGEIIGEPLHIHGWGTANEISQRVAELAERVGLPPSSLTRYPHEFSGGQRQRIGIARAIALKPKLIICDEPVSALDVSIQSQILNLLMELQQELGIALLFISHDLAVVKHISDRIAVMYLGKLVEVADAETLYRAPRHPYTSALIDAIPQPQPGLKQNRRVLQGEPPSPIHPPSGCRFHPRCPHMRDGCSTKPVVLETDNNHLIACHYWREIKEAP